MPKHETMMVMTPEERRKFFRACYAIELGRLHASGRCAWPIERLPDMVERVARSLEMRIPPSGPAFDAAMKFFGLKTQKALWLFLGV